MYKDYYYAGPSFEERLATARKQQATIDAIPDLADRLKANRARYRCGDSFVTLADIPLWGRRAAELAEAAARTTTPQTSAEPTTAEVADKLSTHGFGGVAAAPSQQSQFTSAYSWDNPRGWGGYERRTATVTAADKKRRFPVDAEVNSRVSIFQGDITTLEIDAIVNAANESLRGGGGIDGAIHRAAGPLLEDAGGKLNGCEVGKAKITTGFALPARFVIHTVGPVGKGDALLRACYKSSLEIVVSQNIRSVAFCCVSTGIFGFPLIRAAHIALRTVRQWLDDPKNRALCERIIFCVFTSEELSVYEALMPSYFPIDNFPAESCPPGEEDAVPIAEGAEEVERKALEVPRGGWWEDDRRRSFDAHDKGGSKKGTRSFWGY